MLAINHVNSDVVNVYRGREDSGKIQALILLVDNSLGDRYSLEIQ